MTTNYAPRFVPDPNYYQAADGRWYRRPETIQYQWVPPYTPPVAKTSIPFRHGRHVVASILTGGMWLPFYAMLWIGHVARRPKQVTRWN